MMKSTEQQRTNHLYEQHVTYLTWQGKRSATIDGYSRALRCITVFFDRRLDELTTDDLKQYFGSFIKSHS